MTEDLTSIGLIEIIIMLRKSLSLN